MNIKHRTPVELAISGFGGVRPLARAVNRDPAAISRWQKSGTIPSSVLRVLLKEARERGIELTSDDVIFGRLDD